MRRNAWWAVAGTVAVVAVTVIGVAAASLLGARSDLLAARVSVQQAQEAVTEGDLDKALTAFSDASAHFGDGRARLNTAAIRTVGWVPGVDHNVQAGRRLALAGEHVTAAGIRVAEAVGDLPEGADSFAPRDGGIPLEPLHAVAGPLEAAAADLAEAQGLVDSVSRRWLVGPVEQALAEAADQVGQAAKAFEAGAALTAELPAFLGADGPRHYFLGAQNPAELRGTGGLIGAFSILTADQGRLDIGEFQTIGVLTAAAPDELPPPSSDYESRYARYSASVHGSNVNMTPDVPTASAAIQTLHAAVTGDELDGVVLADPLFLQALLEVVGPTDVPEIGTIDAASLVAFATRDQYAEFGELDDRKEALGEVAGAVLRRFLAEGIAHPREAITTLADAVADGRLRLHANDDAVQAAFSAAGVDGALTDPDGDYLAVVGNNAAANKLDTFLEQDITYQVKLEPNGSVLGRLTLEVRNTAPTVGYHPAVIGPNVDFLSAGENRTHWSVYCAPGCQLTEFRRDGEPEPAGVERELDRPVISTMVQLPSGESQVLDYEWVVPNAWRHVDGVGVYRLDVDTQPTLATANRMTIEVRPPGDHHVTASSSARAVTTERATWVGQQLDGPFTVELDSSRRAQVLQSVRSILDRPLLAAPKHQSDVQ